MTPHATLASLRLVMMAGLVYHCMTMQTQEGDGGCVQG